MAWLRAMLPRCNCVWMILDFQMLFEQEGELRAAVTMEAVVLRDETAEIVKDITPEEETTPSPMAGAVIYMVQPGGYALENCQALPHDGENPCGQ